MRFTDRIARSITLTTFVVQNIQPHTLRWSCSRWLTEYQTVSALRAGRTA